MMRFWWLISLFIIGCSAFEGGGDLSSNRVASACVAGLEEIFRTQYYPFLVTNCAACHQAGGAGKGGFADADLTTAFNEFQLRGSAVVAGRAIDINHQAPFTGPHLEPDINRVEPIWQAALVEAATCTSNLDNGPGVSPFPSSANFKTTAKVLSATENTKTLTWNLTSELEIPTGAVFSGASFSINYQRSTTATGETSYIFSNPRLTTGGSALHVALVEIELNGQFMTSATTYRAVDRYIPATDIRDLSLTSMVVPAPVADTDTLTITFGALEEITFNPVSFADLSAASGIFATSCNSCHNAGNAQGGLDLTNYNGLLAQFMVVPLSPNGSEVYKRMIDSANPMPPSGLLPQTQQHSVRDWILDGAMEN